VRTRDGRLGWFRSTGLPAAATAAALVLATATACDQSLATDQDAGDGGSLAVTVVRGADRHRVDLGGLPTTSVEGTEVVGLQAVLAAALPGEDLTASAAAFVASDGFRPEDRDFCIGLIPVPWATLAQGYLRPDTRDLLWDAGLGYPGCMSPRDITLIEVVFP
jgi:hypothetical protein